MSFKIAYDDICKMNVDAIVNSVGINSQEQGSVCRLISHFAHSNEIDELLLSHKNGKVFDLYVTEGGKLPAKNIIHIVTPFKKLDLDLELLKKAYIMVIEKAIECGYKSIAIPFLGTGANGYSHSDVFKTVIGIGGNYNNSNKIDVTVVMYNRRVENNINELVENRSRINGLFKNKDRYSIEKIYAAEYMDEGIANSIYVNRIFATMSKKEMFNPGTVILNSMDFIWQYVIANKLEKNLFYMFALSRGSVSKCINGTLGFKKKYIYIAALLYGFNRTVFLQAMSFGGYSFNVVDPVDMWMYKYYSNNVICKDPGELYERYHDDIIFKALFGSNTKFMN